MRIFKKGGWNIFRFVEEGFENIIDISNLSILNKNKYFFIFIVASLKLKLERS